MTKFVLIIVAFMGTREGVGVTKVEGFTSIKNCIEQAEKINETTYCIEVK